MFVLWSPCARQEKVSFQENWRCIDAARFFSQNKERLLWRFGGITSLQIRITKVPAQVSEFKAEISVRSLLPLFSLSLLYFMPLLSLILFPLLSLSLSFLSHFSLFLYFPFLVSLILPIFVISCKTTQTKINFFTVTSRLCSDLVAFISWNYKMKRTYWNAPMRSLL